MPHDAPFFAIVTAWTSVRLPVMLFYIWLVIKKILVFASAYEKKKLEKPTKVICNIQYWVAASVNWKKWKLTLNRHMMSLLSLPMYGKFHVTLSLKRRRCRYIPESHQFVNKFIISINSKFIINSTINSSTSVVTVILSSLIEQVHNN